MQLGFKFAASLQGTGKLQNFWNTSTAYVPEEADSQKKCPEVLQNLMSSGVCVLPREWLLLFFLFSHLTWSVFMTKYKEESFHQDSMKMQFSTLQSLQ